MVSSKTRTSSFQTRFAVDISPSKEVTEYTATITYKLLNEGKDGQQKVDSMNLALRAEGMMMSLKSHLIVLCRLITWLFFM